MTPEERYALLKRYDTPRDYTYYKTEAENKSSCAGMVTVSKQLKAQCRMHGLPYYDTSYGREQVFNAVLERLARDV